MTSKLMRGAIWIAIGALIAAALVCVVWVLVGDQDGIVGRAFLTILLLAVFAGIAIMESNLAERRPDWLALASMITWIVALLVGAVKIWLPEEDHYGGWGMIRFWQLILVIGILQLALLHARIFLRASQRYVTTFTRVIMMVTFALLAALAAMLVFFLTFPDEFDYGDLYWRIVIALTILVAVGSTLIPLLNALFAPRKPQAQTPQTPQAPQTAPAMTGWPTYADGRTPLPALPDATPDWNAYYTGHPTYAAPQSFPVIEAPAAAPAAPAAPATPAAHAAPQAQAFASAPTASSIPDPAVPPAPDEPAPPFQPPQPPTPGPGPETPPSTPPAPATPPSYGGFPPPPPAPPAAPGSMQ
ncbi:hypothetical protein ACFWHT_03165 [Microbacterium sp. NPDC058342]|uniref:hypothetical protein n=1 Tax=Microbacterium sp. NPDC058342 TaxID=3346454 RepID=UPI003658A2E1